MPKFSPHKSLAQFLAVLRRLLLQYPGPRLGLEPAWCPCRHGFQGHMVVKERKHANKGGEPVLLSKRERDSLLGWLYYLGLNKDQVSFSN